MQVRAALVDPSCSGSGTERARLDALLPGGIDTERLQARLQRLADVQVLLHASHIRWYGRSRSIQHLAAYVQVRLVSHALKLPALERLVYSTCSVHPEENEEVVARMLPLAHRLGFKLAKALPGWHRRGLPGHCKGHHKLLRADPEQDHTDGFFVCLFVRSIDGAAA